MDFKKYFKKELTKNNIIQLVIIAVLMAFFIFMSVVNYL